MKTLAISESLESSAWKSLPRKESKVLDGIGRHRWSVWLNWMQRQESYENPLENISKAFWNQFLKANNQERGIMSYSYMVALVINYFEDRSL